MSLKKDENGIYYKPNPLRKAKGIFDKSKYASWQPEHERLNIEPVAYTNFSSDFLNKKKKRRVEMPAMKAEAPSLRAPQAPQAPQAPPVPQGFQPYQESYMIPYQIPGQAFNPLHKVPKDIEYEEIPDPPANQFSNQYFEDVDQTNNVDLDQMSLLDVEDNEYCVFISGALFCSSPSKDDIEDVLDKLVFSDKNIPVDEIVVMKRIKIKIGANLDG